MDCIIHQAPLDSIDSKNEKIITLFTTNHPKNIHPAMHRPGRIDLKLNIDPPDAEAVSRLIRQYANGLLEEGTDLSSVSKKLENQIPAVIHEVVKRSKLVAVRRLKGSTDVSINGHDLLSAAETLLKEKEDFKTEEVPLEHPALAIGELLGIGIGHGLTVSEINGKDKMPIAFHTPVR